MKEWTIEVYILDEAGNEKPARCFTKVVYNLHPSFENPVQSKLSRRLIPSPLGSSRPTVVSCGLYEGSRKLIVD